MLIEISISSLIRSADRLLGYAHTKKEFNYQCSILHARCKDSQSHLPEEAR